MHKRPLLSFWQIWNMSFGFLGIQFGFALQGGFMSRIFQSLGANKDALPLLWLAAPLTGLIVQPIIGYLSDKTWHPKLGRRRPYFLIGAVLSSLVLIVVPHSPVLWVAVGCLWILDASMNISMEPFRALVADNLADEQRTYGFMVQTLIIGVGTWVASNLPWFVNEFLGVSNSSGGGVPANVKVAFAVGGFVFLASILVTIFTTKEYTPEEMAAFNQADDRPEVEHKDIGFNFFKNYHLIPPVMWKLGLVQFFSWFAFFTMWNMYVPAVTEHVFDAPAPIASAYDLDSADGKMAFEKADQTYNQAADKAGAYMGSYGLSSMIFAFILTLLTAKVRINRKYLHMVSLILGGLGFYYMKALSNPNMLHLSFILIGFAWGSILSMPYAMLSSSIDPKKMGLYMGLFNMFIVIPQIVASVGGINFAYKTLFGDATINTMMLAGTCLILAGLSNLLITEKSAVR
ncbi:MAG: MFS transporter [Bdellovibrionota bacterium]